VQSLAHPGENITGFALFEASMGAKWLEALKELEPQTKAAALMFNPAMAPYYRMYLHSMEAAAPALAIRTYALPVHDKTVIAQSFVNVADHAGTGIIVLLDAFTLQNRDLIISEAAEHRVPVVYADRQFAESGGAVAFGVDRIDQFREAGLYIDRIFKGTKPGDLPVQHPTRFELVINLKCAKGLGISIPQNLLTRADEVIE
jgi:putative ABC transport system substrate-binding protein